MGCFGASDFCVSETCIISAEQDGVPISLGGNNVHDLRLSGHILRVEIVRLVKKFLSDWDKSMLDIDPGFTLAAIYCYSNG